MSNPSNPESQPTPESNESFEDVLKQFEQTHTHKAPAGDKRLEGTVVAVSAESVFLDIGYKTEGILPLAPFQGAGETVKVGDKFQVSVKGRNPEGYYELSRLKVELPKDWSALEQAFAEKTTILGTVTGVVKGEALVGNALMGLVGFFLVIAAVALGIEGAKAFARYRGVRKTGAVPGEAGA